MTLTQEQILQILNTCYEKAIQGIPKTKNCYELASEYLEKYDTPEIAIDKFVNAQVAKCTTSGFVTSLGGLITLPVAVPANLASVWYVQLRMIATIAVIGGHDPSDDEVQTLAFICLVGGSVTKLCREAGIQFANKVTTAMLKKLPGSLLTKINQKVCFRFLTKSGTKGLVNLGKLVPIAGGVVGGGIDFVGTHIIAKKAKDVFLYDRLD